MADFGSNPFADPETVHGDAANPFSDPSIQQAQQPVANMDFNPFDSSAKTVAAQQPAVMHPTEQPPAYSPSAAQIAPTAEQRRITEDLQRRQEELERKAAELQRKEQEMRNIQHDGQKNNFPPLPDKCCVQPCFYQDFEVDIPSEFQRIVKMLYYLWLFYIFMLILNVIGTIAFLSTNGDDAGKIFGLSILYLILFTPCSFVCWYRPVYKAFKSDSSFNFFLFFFIFFMQFIVTIVQALGLGSFGTCGWIVTLSHFGRNKVAASIMTIIALGFSLLAAAEMFLLIKVHGIYRGTGASFAKAQAEFQEGVLRNRNVQNAAGNIAQNAAREAVNNQFNSGANRY